MGACCSSSKEPCTKDSESRSMGQSKSIASLIPPTNVVNTRTTFTVSGHPVAPVTIYAFQETSANTFTANHGGAQYGHHQAFYADNHRVLVKTAALADSSHDTTGRQPTLNSSSQPSAATPPQTAAVLTFFSATSNNSSTTLTRNAGVATPVISNNAGGSGATKKQVPQSSGAVSEAKIVQIFERYREKADTVVATEGILRLCQDLKLAPEDFQVLIFAWKLDAQQMGRFTRDEFVNGCKLLRADSIKGIQQRLSELVQVVQLNEEAFKDLYRFAYRFALDSELGQRTLSLDMAIQLWRLCFSRRKADGSVPLLLEQWLSFLKKHSTSIRGIPKDTWNMFLHFVDSVDENFNGYSPLEAWPSLFDDFVEYEVEQTRIYSLSS